MSFPLPADYLNQHSELIYPWRGHEFLVSRDDGHIRISLGHEYRLADTSITWQQLEETIHTYRLGAWETWTNQL